MRYSASSETVAGSRNLAFHELCLAIKCPRVYLFLEFLDFCGQERPEETLRERAREASPSKVLCNKQIRNAAAERAGAAGGRRAGVLRAAARTVRICRLRLLTWQFLSWPWQWEWLACIKEIKTPGPHRDFKRTEMSMATVVTDRISS